MTSTYFGKRCATHPALGGERKTSNDRCVACWRAYRREYQRTHRKRRHVGAVCPRHADLKGERRNGNCPACQRERKSDPESRKRWRARKDPVKRRKAILKWRENNPEQWLAIASARNTVRRARKRIAIVGNSRVINRAWAVLRRKAKRLGMVIDHVVPLAPCRVCSTQGEHVQSNWQLLTPGDNSSKGNRCMSCWRRDTLSMTLPEGR